VALKSLADANCGVEDVDNHLCRHQVGGARLGRLRAENRDGEQGRGCERGRRAKAHSGTSWASLESYTYNTAVQPAGPFFPIGVWYVGPAVRRDLQTIKSLGFNSIWSRAGGDVDLVAQAGAAGLKVVVNSDRMAELQVGAAATAADLRLWGWTALLHGARAIGYHAWHDLIDERGAVTSRGKAAGAFAGVVTRNPALFVPLRPRALAEPDAALSDVRISGVAGQLEAGLLESRDALVLLAVNHAGEPQRVTLTFAPGSRQEFWQNMETGEMVSFAMEKDSPSLSHDFNPRDALVLMIRKTSPHDRLAVARLRRDAREGGREPGSARSW
jgi:hypothetical protein